MKKPENGIEPFWKDSSLGGTSEVISSLGEKKGTSLFLGRYSQSQVLAALRRKSILKEAKKRRLWPLKLVLDSRHYPLQRFQVFFKESRSETMIVDLKIQETEYPLNIQREGRPSVIVSNTLWLEWLTLQNPLSTFAVNKGPLPGQEFPGLNLSKKVVDIFVDLAALLRKDCLLAFPAYFHNAVLFSRFFRFVNPAKEGELFAILRILADIPFRQVAWIIYLNSLRRADGSVYEWKAEEQMLPLNEMWRQYFNSADYKERVKEVLESSSFSVDWQAFKAHSAQAL